MEKIKLPDETIDKWIKEIPNIESTIQGYKELNALFRLSLTVILIVALAALEEVRDSRKARTHDT